MSTTRVVEHEMDVNGVPAVRWRPDDPPRGLVLFAHGYTVHKRSHFQVPWARALAGRGFVAVALDLPGHGDRQPAGADDRRSVDRDWRAHWLEHGGTVIASEFTAAVDVTYDEFGPIPVAFWGLSLGTQAGMAFVGHDDRVRAAVFGLAPLHGPRVAAYAARITCPVFFVQQLDDELWPAARTTELFEAIASEDKELVSSPGPHEAVPRAVMQRAVEFVDERLS